MQEFSKEKLRFLPFKGRAVKNNDFDVNLIHFDAQKVGAVTTLVPDMKKNSLTGSGS